MRLRAYPLLVVLAACPAFVLTPAVAQTAKGDAVTEMARKRFEEGVKLFDQGDYPRAQAAFLQAWALKQHPAVLLNLAQSELRAGEHVAAARHFAQYLRDYSDTPADQQAIARQGLQQARAHTGQLDIVYRIEGAEVLVDGEPVGRTPLGSPVDVEPGTHTVEVRAAGLPPVSVQATVGAAGHATVQIGEGEGAKVAPAPAPGPGPAATPKPEPESPAPTPEPEAVETPEGPERKSFIAWAESDPVAWGTLGATGLGLGLGVAFAALAKASTSDADNVAAQISAVADRDDGLANYQGYDRRENPCADPIPITADTDYRPACGQLREHLDSRDSRKTMMWVGFGLMAAGAVGTGVAYYVRTDPSEDEGAARGPARGYAAVTPVWSPELTGLGVIGTF